MKGKNSFNFWLDISVLLGFIIVALSGVVLWVVIPHERGSDTLTFLSITRLTWIDVHNWAGLFTLLAMTIHLIIHWTWINAVAKRFFGKLARQARVNFSLNSLLFLGFILANISGLAIWLILPSGGFEGGRNPNYGAMWFSLDRHGWTDIHLYASLAMMTVGLVHIILHWPWITTTARRVTRRWASAVPAKLSGQQSAISK